jgi:hypothetical protein
MIVGRLTGSWRLSTRTRARTGAVVIIEPIRFRAGTCPLLPLLPALNHRAGVQMQVSRAGKSAQRRSRFEARSTNAASCVCGGCCALHGCWCTDPAASWCRAGIPLAPQAAAFVPKARSRALQAALAWQQGPVEQVSLPLACLASKALMAALAGLLRLVEPEHQRQAAYQPVFLGQKRWSPSSARQAQRLL